MNRYTSYEYWPVTKWSSCKYTPSLVPNEPLTKWNVPPSINTNRRKFRIKLQTMWTDMDRWKSRGGKSQRGEEKQWEDQRRERERRKKMQVHQKVRKSRFTVFFQWFVALGGRKVGSLKRRGAEPSGQMRDQKLHAAVARSTFLSQKCQKPTVSDQFWKLRCRKSARRCGTKHISKSKVSKTDGFGALLEVSMWKKCTRLWREAHFQVKSVKNWRVRSTFGSFDVEKSVRGCGAKHISKSKVSKTDGFGAFLEVSMWKKCTRLWREAHFQVKMQKKGVRTTFGR